MCEEVEVTESMGFVARRSLVRYYCGKTTRLVKVEETNSCVYTATIAVKGLCDVPGFKETVTDTKVWKCEKVTGEGEESEGSKDVNAVEVDARGGGRRVKQ